MQTPAGRSASTDPRNSKQAAVRRCRLLCFVATAVLPSSCQLHGSDRVGLGPGFAAGGPMSRPLPPRAISSQVIPGAYAEIELRAGLSSTGTSWAAGAPAARRSGAQAFGVSGYS